MSDLADARKRITEYSEYIASVDDGLSADYEDGYLDGLEYALKLLGGDDAR